MQAGLGVVAMTVVLFPGLDFPGLDRLRVMQDPAEIMIGPDASEAQRDRAVAALCLARPPLLHRKGFLEHAARGDLDRGIVRAELALRLILQRLTALPDPALAAAIRAMPRRLHAAPSPATLSGRLILAGSILGFSLPGICGRSMAIVVGAVEFGRLASTGRGVTAEILGIVRSLPAVGLAADVGWERLVGPCGSGISADDAGPAPGTQQPQAVSRQGTESRRPAGSSRRCARAASASRLRRGSRPPRCATLPLHADRPMLIVLRRVPVARDRSRPTQSFLDTGVPVTEPPPDLSIVPGHQDLLSDGDCVSLRCGKAPPAAIGMIDRVGGHLRKVLNTWPRT